MKKTFIINLCNFLSVLFHGCINLSFRADINSLKQSENKRILCTKIQTDVIKVIARLLA